MYVVHIVQGAQASSWRSRTTLAQPGARYSCSAHGSLANSKQQGSRQGLPEVICLLPQGAEANAVQAVSSSSVPAVTQPASTVPAVKAMHPPSLRQAAGMLNRLLRTQQVKTVAVKLCQASAISPRPNGKPATSPAVFAPAMTSLSNTPRTSVQTVIWHRAAIVSSSTPSLVLPACTLQDGGNSFLQAAAHNTGSISTADSNTSLATRVAAVLALVPSTSSALRSVSYLQRVQALPEFGQPSIVLQQLVQHAPLVLPLGAPATDVAAAAATPAASHVPGGVSHLVLHSSLSPVTAGKQAMPVCKLAAVGKRQGAKMAAHCDPNHALGGFAGVYYYPYGQAASGGGRGGRAGIGGGHHGAAAASAAGCAAPVVPAAPLRLAKLGVMLMSLAAVVAATAAVSANKRSQQAGTHNAQQASQLGAQQSTAHSVMAAAEEAAAAVTAVRKEARAAAGSAKVINQAMPGFHQWMVERLQSTLQQFKAEQAMLKAEQAMLQAMADKNRQGLLGRLFRRGRNTGSAASTAAAAASAASSNTLSGSAASHRVWPGWLAWLVHGKQQHNGSSQQTPAGAAAAEMGHPHAMLISATMDTAGAATHASSYAAEQLSPEAVASRLVDLKDQLESLEVLMAALSVELYEHQQMLQSQQQQHAAQQ